MKLADKVAEKLARLDSFSGKQTISAGDERARLECDVLATEAISCSFDELRIAAADGAPLDGPALRACADGVARRVNYLLEPLRVIEVDEPAGVAVIRSSPPDKRRKGQAAYYELRLTARRALSLRRYQAADHRRRAVPCHATKEAFVKLVDDLAAAVA